jgi:hypothetical protein
MEPDAVRVAERVLLLERHEAEVQGDIGTGLGALVLC